MLVHEVETEKKKIRGVVYLHGLSQLFDSLMELCKLVSNESTPTKSVLNAICITLL